LNYDHEKSELQNFSGVKRMSDHFLVRAGQTLVVISCSLKFERMGFPGIRGSHKAELSIGPKGFTQQKGFATKEVLFSLVKK